MIPEVSVIETSMTTGEGISLIEDRIVSMVYGGSVSQQNSVMAVSYTHLDVYKRQVYNQRFKPSGKADIGCFFFYNT